MQKNLHIINEYFIMADFHVFLSWLGLWSVLHHLKDLPRISGCTDAHVLAGWEYDQEPVSDVLSKHSNLKIHF